MLPLATLFSDSTAAHWLTVHGLITAVAVLLYVITSHLMHQRRNPAAAIAWILFILLVPYLALPAFLAFGSRKLERPRKAPILDSSTASSIESWSIETILALGQPAPAEYTALSIHADGQAAQAALFETIDAATQTIDVSTFILGRDKFGEAVIERLCGKAASGVRVRLLLDGMGRLMARSPSLKTLRLAGAQCVLFVPPLHSPLKGRTNLRNHRKLLISDAQRQTGRLWCGGRNLAADYFEGHDGLPPWRDLTFDLRGPLVAQAHTLFERDWAFATRRPRDLQPHTRRDGAWTADGAQLVASGPDQLDDTVHALLVTAAYRARRRIILVTPYFVPESALLMALCLAARRGVTVDLLLPARSNHRLSDLARNRAMRSLADAGGRIWLAPGMLHAKLAVVDQVMALAGSANLDSRSLFLNYELMVAFHASADVERFVTWFETERLAAHPYVAKEPGFIRDVAEGMLLWVGFQL